MTVKNSWREIDQHAVNTPEWAEQSLLVLVTYLTKWAQDDFEVVRLFFRWIAEHIAYDVKGFRTGHYEDLSQEGVLRRREAVCAGYAQLFQGMAQLAGVPVVKISGNAKGYSYKVGRKTLRDSNHAWNGVKLGGRWYLLDVTWGTGHIQRGYFVRRLDNFYFLTPPEQLIYSHFPDNSNWQLLSPAISFHTFADLPHVRPAFFDSGLSLKSHLERAIQVHSEAVITLGAPKSVWLMAKLRHNGHNLDDSLAWVWREGTEYKVGVRVPEPGSYILRLFVKRGETPYGNYAHAVDYQVIGGR